MKAIKLVALMMVILSLTACGDGRYSGLRLWAPGEPDHESLCGIHDWKTDVVLPVEAVPEGDWDHSDWDWVPREGCPQ